MSWDSSLSDINDGSGINEWSQADIKELLNGYYIGEEGKECRYCTGGNQGTCENDCTSSVTPLSSTSLDMIDRVLWNTGAITYSETLPLSLSSMYLAERGTRNGKICLPTSTENGVYICIDTVERTTTWEGLIGLIYPSDYGYASTDESCAHDIYESNSTCNVNNWLHPSSGCYWTISPAAHSNYALLAFDVSPSLHVKSNAAWRVYGVRPSLYLSSNVQIIGGDGYTTPFKLSVN